MKLQSIMISPNEKKKYTAIFILDNGKEKMVHFGQKGYSDFTQHHDENRKSAYLERHEKRENWDNPLTAGSLSRWILWNKKSLIASIYDFKDRFHL